MVPDGRLRTRGYYVVVRYRPDVARGEFRNVGVAFVDEDTGIGELKSLPAGSLGRTVEEHGVVANALYALRARVEGGALSIDELAAIASEHSHSLLLSEPLPAVGEVGTRPLVSSLYQTLVAPRTPSTAGYTKGQVLNRLARWFEARGTRLEVAAYVDDLLFDGVLPRRDANPWAMHVSSFAARSVDLKAVEREVGHFLFAVPRVNADCLAVIQPPSPHAETEYKRMHRKVLDWLGEAQVDVMTPESVRSTFASARGVAEVRQLALPV